MEKVAGDLALKQLRNAEVPKEKFKEYSNK